MAGEKPKWPRFSEPATKGDVIAALVSARTCIVDIYVCLRALERNDLSKLTEALDRLSENDDKLAAMVDRLGGSGGQ